MKPKGHESTLEEIILLGAP